MPTARAWAWRSAVGLDDFALDVLDISDPALTNVFLTRTLLPAEPSSVALAGGIAFVADGTAGLQVVNFLPFDNLAQAPAVTLSSPVADVDPGTPGVQVVEGSSILLRADVTDDVQMRNVELIVNGQVVRNDVSFPFDLTAIALGVDPNPLIVTVQARATDTGGNRTLSQPLTFNLVPDTIAPALVSANPADGMLRAPGLRHIELTLLGAAVRRDRHAEHLPAAGDQEERSCRQRTCGCGPRVASSS